MKKSIAIFGLFLMMVSLTSFTSPNEIGGNGSVVTNGGRNTQGEIYSEIGGRNTQGEVYSEIGGRNTQGEVYSEIGGRNTQGEVYSEIGGRNTQGE